MACGQPKRMKTLRGRRGASASALRPSFRSARSFTSAGGAGDLVAGILNQPESRLQRSRTPFGAAGCYARGSMKIR
jgi:hypothetical protein